MTEPLTDADLAALREKVEECRLDGWPMTRSLSYRMVGRLLDEVDRLRAALAEIAVIANDCECADVRALCVTLGFWPQSNS